MTTRTTPWLWISIFIVGSVFSGVVSGQRLVTLVGRDTGSIEVVNAGSDAFELNGYELKSASGLLSVESWNSLTDQGVAGFVEANPREIELAELAFPPAATVLGGGEAVSLGNAYRGGALLPSDEDIIFRFTSAEGEIFSGNVHYLGQSQVPSINVDRVSGNIQLSNPSGFAIDGYTIASPSGLLTPGTFVGLEDREVPGWFEAQPTSVFISELNPQGSLTFEGGATFDLGQAYDASAGASISEQDLSFRYSTPEGEVHDGVVSYTGPIADLVLEVDSITGAARIQNTSAAVEPFDIVAYDIFSPSGSLSVEGWNSLADSGDGGAGWFEANPRSDALSELNPSGSTVFESGTSISIGRILTGAEDLIFQYATTDGAAFGSVDYVLGVGTPTEGDCNGDGVLNAADLECVATIAERDAVLSALNTLAGDLNGDGSVAFGDFVTLSSNFGQDLPAYTDGNIDLAGDIGFADFVVMSTNFGQTPAASPVPEPTNAWLAVMGWLLFPWRRQSR